VLTLVVLGAFVAVYLAVYFVVARAVPRFPEAIKAGRVSGATLLAALAVAVGLLNAAAMTS
jgi:uncharacterized membrane protein YjfL (UPF0719 family)